MILTNVDEYEPSSMARDLFISSMPISIITESIKEQFDEAFDNVTDYMSIYIDGWTSSFSECNPDDINELRDIKDDFLSEIRMMLKKTYEIGFPNFDELSDDEQNETVRMVYRFFIVNGLKNLVHYCTNYIDSNKGKLVEALLLVNQTDVTMNKFKKEISDNDILLILANLSTVIDYIFEEGDTVDSFLQLAAPRKFAETQMMDKYYDELIITGNFIPSLFAMIDNDTKMEILTKVRNKLIKRYAKENMKNQ